MCVDFALETFRRCIINMWWLFTRVSSLEAINNRAKTASLYHHKCSLRHHFLLFIRCYTIDHSVFKTNSFSPLAFIVHWCVLVTATDVFTEAGGDRNTKQHNFWLLFTVKHSALYILVNESGWVHLCFCSHFFESGDERANPQDKGRLEPCRQLA